MSNYMSLPWKILFENIEYTFSEKEIFVNRNKDFELKINTQKLLSSQTQVTGAFCELNIL